MRLFRFFRSLAFVFLWPAGGWGQLVRVENSSLNLPADLPAATGYTTSNALGSLTFINPMCTAFPPGETNRLYVLERGADGNVGRIQVVNNLSGTPVPATFMDLETHLGNIGTPLISTATEETGMLSMVFHPNYNQNGYFYVYFSISVNSQRHQRLARFQATDPDLNPATANYNAATSAEPSTMLPMLTMRDEASNHNGGDLAFGADGYLYLSLGDEGNANDSFNNARFINRDFWGQLLRLDVDLKPENLVPNAHSQPNSTDQPSAIHPGTYKVPADNPFIGYTSWHGLTIAANTVRTEIYASGLRNPFRFSIDPPTGRLFLADVGQGTYEEVNIIEKGGDYGWSWREGLHDFVGEPAPTSPPAGYDSFRKDPIYEYDHTNDGSGNDAVIYGSSITGGVVYRGNQLTELQGKYLFADVYGGGGLIAALAETSPGVWTGQRLTTRAQIVDFGTDPRNGEPLLCSLQGTIWRLARAGTSGTNPPLLLSGTGAFSSLATLTPNAGIVAYDPNVSFWSDNASKSRWFAIKNPAATIGYSADGNWTFPTGMVWVKHFDFDLGAPAGVRRLETRFLVKTAGDIYGLSYRWRNFASGAQSEADLVVEEGQTAAITGAQNWRFPSRGECRTCHTPVGGFALSFNTRQLNRAHVYGLQTQNQLTALSSAGYCTSPITNVQTLPAFARTDDASQSFEWRVRSYLAVNCVQCHQPGGAAQGYWDARPTTPTDTANLINALLVNNSGDGDARFVVKNGDPAFALAHSMALKRLRGDGVPRMPPLATNVRDFDAEALLSAWITQELPARQSFAEWQMAQFPSGGANAAPGADADGDGRDNTEEFLRRTIPQAADPPALPVVAATSGNVSLTFLHPAHRAGVIETSLDLQNWTLWNVPGNAPLVPFADQTRQIVVPIDAARRFFRARFTVP